MSVHIQRFFPRLWRLRWRRPQPLATFVVVLCAEWLLFFVISMLLAAGNEEENFVGITLLGSSCCFSLPMLFLMLPVLNRFKHIPSRFLIARSITAIATLGTAAGLLVWFTSSGDDAAAAGFSLMMWGALALVMFLITSSAHEILLQEEAEAGFAERLRLLQENLQAVGHVPVDTLMDMLATSAEGVSTLTGALHETFPIVEEGGLLLSEAWVQEKQRGLHGALSAHQQIHERALRESLGVSRPILKLLVRMLTRSGRFSGIADWERGVLYTLPPELSGDDAPCQCCGGEVVIVGMGVRQCQHCNAEIFFSVR